MGCRILIKCRFGISVDNIYKYGRIVSKILLMNGPNLNLLGDRETHVYGSVRLEEIEKHLAELARTLGHTLMVYQSNHEGALIDRVQQARREGTGFLILNPGGYTHTSVALRDAVAAAAVPFIEIHMSNIQAREDFRRQSYFSELALGTIAGFGAHGYELALLAADRRLKTRTT
ncbi:MAG: type II 3-dehydroquinate dehydratase [Gammaproteobacteria bacterium]|nr:type II 3-dehydroquinate dehydratase [Gammaproteobacteria bacterium]MDE2346415.1 type II 3-dehydroquinate dehydratase [Gammaproteobacteria bacterium]